MATLYELNQKFNEFEFEIDEETGEILNAEELDKIELERNEKLENIGLWIKNLESDAEAYKREKDSFAEKERLAKNKVESLKKYLNFVLNGDTFKSDRVNITYRKSTALNVIDEYVIPKKYFVKQAPKLDKKAVKDAIKSGKKVKGAEIIEKENIQIK